MTAAYAAHQSLSSTSAAVTGRRPETRLRALLPFEAAANALICRTELASPADLVCRVAAATGGVVRAGVSGGVGGGGHGHGAILEFDQGFGGERDS